MQALIAGAVLVLAACAVLAAAACAAWTWPAADLFCVCGRSRAAAGDGRDIQSLSEGR
jgi:hypothetical protein